MRLTVVVAAVALHAVLDLGKLPDGHSGEIGDGLVILLFQPEPDGVRAGLGEAGLVGAVCAVLGAGVGRSHALGGKIRRNRVRIAIVVAAVVADTVLNLQRGDCKHCTAQYGAVVFLFNFEPDGVCACIGERGQRFCVCAVPGGGVGHGDSLGGDLQTDGVRLAIVGNFVAGGGELNLRRDDYHRCGADDSFAILLLQLEPDSVFACVGEAGQRFCVSAVLGAGVGRGHALGGHAERNRMRVSVIHARVVADAVLDLLRGFDDAEAVADVCAIHFALAGDFHGVAARSAGCIPGAGVSIPEDDRPLLDPVVGQVKLHGLPGVGIAALQSGTDLIADVDLRDLHRHGALYGRVILLFKNVIDDVLADIGDAGVRSAVRAVIDGVAHADSLGDNVHRDGMRLAVVFYNEAVDAVVDLRFGDRHGRAALHVGVEGGGDQVAHGVASGHGERGVGAAVCAVHGIGVAHVAARCGDIDRDAMRLAIVCAAVAAGAVFDLRCTVQRIVPSGERGCIRRVRFNRCILRARKSRIADGGIRGSCTVPLRRIRFNRCVLRRRKALAVYGRSEAAGNGRTAFLGQYIQVEHGQELAQRQHDYTNPFESLFHNLILQS